MKKKKGCIVKTNISPQIAFLGVCERISSIRNYDPRFSQLNILGLRKEIISNIFPLPLSSFRLFLSNVKRVCPYLFILIFFILISEISTSSLLVEVLQEKNNKEIRIKIKKYLYILIDNGQFSQVN